MMLSIKKEQKKERSRLYYQVHREVYLERQKKYNQKREIQNRIYKQNYYKEQRKKTRVTNQIKSIANSVSNQDNTGLLVLIQNMKSRKYQKQKREAELIKRNVIFEFKLKFGDQEPYVFMKKPIIKRPHQPFFKIIKMKKTISFY